MLDARNIYRKVTRKIYDFSTEQMQNMAAIVWLYRGQQKRFLALIKHYLHLVCTESAAIPEAVYRFDRALSELSEIGAFVLALAREWVTEADANLSLR